MDERDAKAMAEDSYKDLKIDVNFKDTCIDFGKYVQQQWARHEDADMLWLEFQDKLSKDVHKILDDCIEGKDNELEFDSIQDKINSEMLQLIADNNAVNDKRHKDNCDVLEILTKVCNVQDKYINNLQSQIKLTDTIVSANGIALNNIEKDLYVDERFVFNKESSQCTEQNKRENVESDEQFNDYVRDKIEEAEKFGFVEPETKQMDVTKKDPYGGNTRTGGLSPDTGPRN